ncbi:glucosidase family protein [Dyadobacter aurulentus]|uniref:hypothetical protein n=1 Tax=Dyadobacter sp. UC 10 TaxID=2605428 RepID=UPI0011F2AA88|nr:hypothetical protein [Dyadobacter sp. UC 10]KAA0993264.1 hypothetical protein FXO21_25355 [Dyadobacter sp. UC 10]
MKKIAVLAFIWATLATPLLAQETKIISDEDLKFLRQLTGDVLDNSRIRAGQSLPAPYGKNNTGGTLIRPGGRDTYPSFWIRDYAMSLETGLVSAAEQKHMLLLTAATQCDQTWITKGGSLVPFGAIADHIRVDDKMPIYFPGTYDYLGQGTEEYGMTPPYCDQFYFIEMGYYYYKSTSDIDFFKQSTNGSTLLERLENAFRVPPTDMTDHLVFTTGNFRGVDFGFRDAIRITGKLVYPSLLKYRAANQLAELLEKSGENKRGATYREIAELIKKTIPAIFLDTNGMLRASTGKSGQPDVWATALAAHWGILDKKQIEAASKFFVSAFKNGTLSYRGSVRHVLTDQDFDSNTAWESAIVPKNTYQNGSYWGTPVGWVALLIGRTDMQAARKLVSEYISELRENDFRKGPGFSSPVECFTDKGIRGPVYLTTVSCPFIALTSDER